jgi:hypothetical protein
MFGQKRNARREQHLLALLLGLLLAAAVFATPPGAALASVITSLRTSSVLDRAAQAQASIHFGAPTPPVATLGAAPDPAALQALQQAELTDTGATANEQFGCAVAISGNTALVGAPYESLNGTPGAGAVFVFTRSGTNWSQQAELTDANGGNFGCSVALSGDTALVGAEYGGVDGSGMAVVFTHSGTGWSQTAELTAPGPPGGNKFGCSVALSGDTALVGAPQGSGGGAAYVFTGSGSEWSLQADLSGGNVFGCSVALSGDTALIGAEGETVDSSALAGAAFVFVRSGTSWSQQAELTADTETDASLGCSVALTADTALVGAKCKTELTQPYAGAAFVFTRSGTRWLQQAALTASDVTWCGYFGSSVALSGNAALVGAPARGGVGAAYVFTRSGVAWSQQARLTSPDATADFFGTCVAISGGAALVGAPYKTLDGKDAAGAAYMDLLDGTSPVTTSSGLHELASSAWQNAPALVTLSASDDPGGYGVAGTYYAIDGGATQTYTAPFALHDGAHAVTYWSVDNLSNVEAAHVGYVSIDSKAPTALARALTLKAAMVKKGKFITLRLSIADPLPSCGRAVLNVTQTTKTGKQLWRLVKVGQPTNRALVVSYKLRKSLKKGTYFMVCSATDAAGNVQALATKVRLKIN